MEPSWVEAVKDWPWAESQMHLQQFLGFGKFYQKFISGYSTVLAPLHHLTALLHPFSWTPDAEQAFARLKMLFMTAQILTLPDPAPSYLITSAQQKYLNKSMLLVNKNSRLLYGQTTET